MKKSNKVAPAKKAASPAGKSSRSVIKAAPHASGKSGGADPMLKELNALAGDLDEAHLLALVTQARAIAEHQRDAASRASAPAPRDTSPLTAPVEIPRPGDKRTLEVKESNDRSSFVLAINNSRNFFTLSEMRLLVKLCHDASDAKDGAARLYQWCKTRRKDVLIDTDIKGPSDEALVTIYEYLVSTYSVKQ
jgi:hypothetical protein